MTKFGIRRKKGLGPCGLETQKLAILDMWSPLNGGFVRTTSCLGTRPSLGVRTRQTGAR